MKTSKRFFVMMVASLLMSTSVWAGGTVTIVKKLNGTVVSDNSAGKVAPVVSVEDGTCTLTVTPAAGNYATLDQISAERIVDAGVAQARRAPSMENSIEVSATDATADPSGVTTYTFQMPGADYDVEVTVDFQTRTSISTGTLTLTLPEGGYFFDGTAKKPAVTVTLSGSTLSASDYAVSYADSINAGTATVTVMGKKTYTGTLTQTYSINKAALSELSVSMEGWTYGEFDEEVNLPSVSGNEGGGEETITYRGINEDVFTEEVPINAGKYVVKVDVAETENYVAGSATAEFTISKAELGEEVYVTIDGWTYGDEPNAPAVEGAPEEASVSYTYFTFVDGEEQELETVPTNAGSYAIKATIGESLNYQGGDVYNEFSIAQADFSGVTIAAIADQTYTGEAITPAVTVTFKGQAVAATEYEVAYDNNVNVGTATVTLSTKNVNFSEPDIQPSITFQIVAAQAVITAENETVTYNGNEQEYSKGSVDKGTLTVTYFATESDRTAKTNALQATPINAGVYYVLLTQGDRNYSSDPVNVTFTIEAKTLTENMMWSEGDEFVYTGEAQTLADGMFGLTDGEYELEYNTDYEISYANNTNVGTATATITGKGNYQGTLTKTFEIVRELNIRFSENNAWASYYAEENLQIPEGLEAYIVTGIGETAVEVSKMTFIPRHQGVLLTYKGMLPEVQEFFAAACTEVPEEPADNLLKGCSEQTAVSTLATESTSIYVLYNDEFVKTISGNIPANRCYLEISSTVPAGARLAIGFGNETTGLKAIGNEQFVISDSQVYDLQGRKVVQPTKGLFIVNGKKVVIK